VVLRCPRLPLIDLSQSQGPRPGAGGGLGEGLLLGGGTTLSLARAPLGAWGRAAPRRTCGVGGSRASLPGLPGLPPCAAPPRVGGAPRLEAIPQVLGRAPRHPPLGPVVLAPPMFPGLHVP
jgi:hypothetical protein